MDRYSQRRPSRLGSANNTRGGQEVEAEGPIAPRIKPVTRIQDVAQESQLHRQNAPPQRDNHEL